MSSCKTAWVTKSTISDTPWGTEIAWRNSSNDVVKTLTLSTPDLPIASKTSASMKVPLDNFVPSSSSTIFYLLLHLRKALYRIVLNANNG